MTIEKIKSRVTANVHEYFLSGYHCAESVAVTVLEEIGEEYQEAAAHATAFGAGFGRTFEGVCGALSGALIAIGHLYGRRIPGENWDLPAELAAQIQDHFLTKHGTTHCGTLREQFDKEQQNKECMKLTGELAAALVELLKRNLDSSLES